MAADPVNTGAQDDDDDDYDEDADSDFDDQVAEHVSATSSDSEDGAKKSGNRAVPVRPQIEELDSGDEATIKERKKLRRKEKRKQDCAQVSSDEEQGEQWRAKTRSMRTQDDLSKQKKSLANIKASTIDVNKLWEEMNKPGPLPPLKIEGQTDHPTTPSKQDPTPRKPTSDSVAPPVASEEMITIKRQFQFAGEVHTEEKVVPKSSAEARLWLSQQETSKKPTDAESAPRERPVRKVSRFDPNYSNLDAFRNDAIRAQSSIFKGPKLNVVEKSKMDWAAHVDSEGLKEELDKHSKAKDAYLNRMDFLGQVGQRKEDEARLARQKG